jgi:hypothetical protein
MPTLPQANDKKTRQEAPPLVKRVQLLLTEDAFLRLKVEAARRQVAPGRVVSDVAVQNLPAVEVAA